MQLKTVAASLFLSLIGFPSVVWGSMTLGSSSELGAIVEKTERENSEISQRPKQPPEPQIEKQRPSTDSVDRSPEAQFFVKKIVLEGNRAIATKTLEKIVSGFENRHQTLPALGAAVKSLEAAYEKKGWLAYVFIPKQEVVGGVLTIRIVESHIGNVLIEGRTSLSRARLLSYAGRHLDGGRLLNLNELRTALHRMNANPRRHVNSSLRPGREPGTTDVALLVEEKKELEGSAFFDNRMARYLGPTRIGAGLQHNNLSGRDDILSGKSVFGKNHGVLLSEYRLPLPEWDSVLTAGVGAAQATPPGDLAEQGINGMLQKYYVSGKKKLIDSRSFSLDFNMGLGFKEYVMKAYSSTYLRSRLRVIQFGPVMRFKDPFGSNYWSQGVSFGLKGLGAAFYADPGSLRQQVHPDFFLYSGQWLREQPLGAGHKWVSRLNYQISGDRLPPQESFFIGGAFSVRGYPEVDTTADTGVIANLEFVQDAFFVPDSWRGPWQSTPLQKQLDVVVFADEGYGRLNDPLPGERKSRILFGAGLGLRIRLDNGLTGRLDWGYALGDKPLIESSRGRFHFGIEYRF